MHHLRKQHLYKIYGKMLWYIREYLKSLKLDKVALFAIGSIAKGEPSCTEVCDNQGRCVLTISDLDLLAFTNTFTYLKCMLLQCNHYVKRLERLFLKKGIDVHISLALTFLLIYRLGLSKFNTIDHYELALVVCSKDKRICRIHRKDKFFDINVRDILDLAISSFIDVLSVILKPEDELSNKDIYVLSKRILTLLYCIELYLGLRPRSFSETPLVATRNFEKIRNFVDKNDLVLLNLLSKIKSHSDCKEAITISQIDVDKLIYLYKNLLKSLLTKLSNHLEIADATEILIHIKESRAISRRKLILLLLTYIALYAVAKLLRRDASMIHDELVIMLRYRIRLADFLRLLALKYLLLMLADDFQITKNISLINIGLKLVDTWYRYMVL